jgi:hypothetical protein
MPTVQVSASTAAARNASSRTALRVAQIQTAQSVVGSVAYEVAERALATHTASRISSSRSPPGRRLNSRRRADRHRQGPPRGGGEVRRPRYHRCPASARHHPPPCRVSVAPLRYGAGMKGKAGEALAAGLPVALTPVAAEGMTSSTTSTSSWPTPPMLSPVPSRAGRRPRALAADAGRRPRHRTRRSRPQGRGRRPHSLGSGEGHGRLFRSLHRPLTSGPIRDEPGPVQ